MGQSGRVAAGRTVDNILAEQVSRNPVIQSILYEAGYVEAFGQGLDTVVAVLKREELPPPRFHDTGASFIVTVFGRAMDAYLNGDDLGLNEPQRVILNFLRTHGEAAHVSCGPSSRNAPNVRCSATSRAW